MYKLPFSTRRSVAREPHGLRYESERRGLSEALLLEESWVTALLSGAGAANGPILDALIRRTVGVAHHTDGFFTLYSS